MSYQTFGDYIRTRRVAIELPLRKVAAYLDIDTSTLSKVERGERPASPDYLKPLSKILGLDLKEVQTKYIADKITNDFGALEHLREGLKAAEKQIKTKKK
ncbi:MAG: helix-turn-helix transcriptional regulator [Bacteroidetes bacterium]|nr:helix-turn-helix transcriptional regulator [Bacteroidota bacterium]MBS1744555.1 helix-turn-helix transcriptional regulator [Bacteroidota bacterium]